MISLGLIGVGSWGRNYLATISKMRNCRISHICAQSSQTLDQFPNSYKKTTQYQDLLSEKKLDGIIIATPAASHFAIASDFIRKNINVLIEKPVVISVGEALKLKRIAEKSSTVLMAGHIFTYNPAFQKLLKLRHSIGSIVYVESEGCDCGPMRSDVSALWDWLPHDISMCLKLFTGEPNGISAWSVKNSMIYIRLIYGNQIPVFIKIGSLSPVKKRNFMVVGTKGSLVFDDLALKKIHYYKYQELSKGQTINQQKCRIKVRYPRYTQIMPLTNELLEFSHRIKSKKKHTDIEEILGIAKVSHAVAMLLKDYEQRAD